MAYFLLVLFFLFFISFLYSSFPPHLLLIELSLCTLAGSLQRPIESSSLCFSSASLILSVWITCPLKVTKRFLVLYFSLLYFLSKLLLFPFLISLLLLIFLPFALLYLFPLCPLSLLKFCFIWIQPFLSWVLFPLRITGLLVCFRGRAHLASLTCVRLLIMHLTAVGLVTGVLFRLEAVLCSILDWCVEKASYPLLEIH